MPYHTNYHHFILVHLLSLLATLIFLNPSTTAQPPEPPPRDDETYGSPLSTAAVIVISVLLGIGIIACYIRQLLAFFRAYVFGGTDGGEGGDDEAVRRRDNPRRGLDPSLEAALPTFLYSDIKAYLLNKTTPLECAICLSEFVDHEQLRLLPICNHVFHPDCIQPWLASHVTCPVCRADLEIQVNGEFLAQVVLRQPSEEEREPSDQVTSPHQGDVIVHVEEPPETATKSPVVRNTNDNVGVVRGKYPRSHSTGHSIIEDRERFTLRLPEEVRNKLVNENNINVQQGSTMVSPKVRSRAKSLSIATTPVKPEQWRFIVSPPFVTRSGSTRSGECSNNDNDDNNNNNNTLSGIMKSPRSFFKSMVSPSNKSPLNRVARCDDIGERSSDRLWPNPTSQELELGSH